MTRRPIFLLPAAALVSFSLSACGAAPVPLKPDEIERNTRVEDVMAEAVAGLPADTENARHDDRYSRRPVRTVRPLNDLRF